MKSNSPDSQLHKALSNATHAILEYINPYAGTDEYILRFNTLLSGIISTTIQIIDVQDHSIANFLWAEVEKTAKAGGYIAVENKIQEQNHYSISEIAPDDKESGMNYLGQKLLTALFKHIHDLPEAQRKPEMYLRAIEAALANILNQKFTEFDKTKILNSFCEHVQMGIKN
jgi:hypothetical protein